MKTSDGYKIVFISDYFFNSLEKALESITRRTGNPSPYAIMALRDEPAKIEFRRLKI